MSTVNTQAYQKNATESNETTVDIFITSSIKTNITTQFLQNQSTNISCLEVYKQESKLHDRQYEWLEREIKARLRIKP